MKVDELGLAEPALTVARELASAHPEVEFMSGRRSIKAQCHAMALDISINRKWIEQTYIPTTISGDLQKWVDEHPDAKDQDDIAVGLLWVMSQHCQDQIAHISKHLAGQAFDVMPHTPEIKTWLEEHAFLHGHKFLSREGGLEIFHYQT